MRAAILLVALTGCTAEPNGLWGNGDGGLAFFVIDGGRGFHPRKLDLREIAFQFYVDCRSLEWKADQLEYRGPDPDFMWSATSVGAVTPARFELREPFIDQGFRRTHRDAGTVGPVWLSFDAGVVFEGPEQASFTWQATYFDDRGELGREGGAAIYEKDESGCR